jgi:hypothetical protein
MTTKHLARNLAVAVSLAVGATATLLPTTAHAADNNMSKAYGCACMHNTKLAGTVKYRYRWGDGEWKKVSLAKGQTDTVCWRYKDAPKSPELEFQLDVDMTGGTKWETFSIARSQSTAVSCSAVPDKAHYHMGYVANSDKKKIQIYGGKN